MATIQWRPEVNALTTPQSYRARVLPRNVIGNDELAAEIAAELDVISPDVARLQAHFGQLGCLAGAGVVRNKHDLMFLDSADDCILAGGDGKLGWVVNAHEEQAD